MQSRSLNATGERIDERDTAAREPAALLDVRAVAALLGGCSVRHVYRLADADRMPRPIKLGHLVRWCRAAIDLWIADGCPSCRDGGRR
jgi:predicted DNA-binding transcriptional regulator AlpA